MTTTKQKKLEQAGWRVGSADDFLALTPEESAYVDLKLSLSRGLRERRTREGITQTALARQIGSSQSRVAKAEASDPGVTVDLLIRALLATGATQNDVAGLIGQRVRKAA